METNSTAALLASPIPSKKGQLKLVSQLSELSSNDIIDVHVYSEMIILVQPQKYIKYCFDLKFQVVEAKIHFSCSDGVTSFQLPLDDAATWRNVLKKYLNQRGFHEYFKPLKKIGKGNFASVFMVEKIEDKTRYAVKSFSKDAAYSEENGKECIAKEIEIMRHLNHPNNMQLHEVFESENSLYFIFELLEGGQLYEKIKNRRPFKPQQVQGMIRNIAEGLSQMHSKNIMHRDLKPENILFRNSKTLECVIADYGLAEFAHEPQYLFVRCGTPGYVAPEVINIKDMTTKYEPICDMFSLGLIFHLLLFGQSVFPGKVYKEVLKQNRACNFLLEGELYHKIDPRALDLLKKMLKVSPQERITSAEALKHPYFSVISFEEPKSAITTTQVEKERSKKEESDKTTNSPKISFQDFQKGKPGLDSKKIENITTKQDRDKMKSLLARTPLSPLDSNS